jgi:hypothetical protein
MEPSKDVLELLEGLQQYMVEQGVLLCEQDKDGVWAPTDVALAELYQDMVEAANHAREERT